MGLSSPVQQKQAGILYHFERPIAKSRPMRHRLHDVLAQTMIIAGIAAAVYGFVIAPLLHH